MDLSVSGQDQRPHKPPPSGIGGSNPSRSTMSRICICGEKIPIRLIIDGKSRNLENRTKCLKCMPFMSSKFASTPESRQAKIKIKSANHYKKNRENVLRCQKALRQSRKQKLVIRAGGKCRICHYDKLLSNLIFHHINPATKLFELNERGLVRKMADIEIEFTKCVLLCCRCHGELHAGLVVLP